MTVLIVSLIIMLIIGIPIAYALGISAMLYFLSYHYELMLVIPQRIFSGFDNPFMVALPLYLIMGSLMNGSGLTHKIINLCNLLVGRIKGGLGNINVFASMLFGGISGSSAADAASIGQILIPEMENRGYEKKFTSGLTVSASTMGIIIPPSIPMVIFASTAEQSIGRMFLAGVLPGILIAILQMSMVTFISYKRNYPQDKRKYTRKEVFNTIRGSMLPLVLPLFVVGTVVLGIATVTESASFGVVYALLVGVLLFRSLTSKNLAKAFLDAIKASATVMAIIATSQLYVWVLSLEKIPQIVTEYVTGLSLPPILLLFAMMIVILIIGTFMDVSPAILLLTPVFFPAAMAVGVSPEQFAALLIAGLAVGLVTPPVGICLNVVAAISKLDIVSIFRGAMPFILCNVIVLILIILIPAISTFLPNLWFGR